ncbi:MAG: glycosyltransferase family 4 protein [Rikenellaceae bacterium]
MKKKICFIVAIPGSANSFLKDHITALSQQYHITLAGDINSPKEVSGLRIDKLKKINIVRKISLLDDLKALVRLYRFFRAEQFSAVHSVTPKAGLLTAIASFMARVPHRIHIFTGQVWATKSGIMRFILKKMDRIIALLNNHLLVDGQSQRHFLIQQNVISEQNSMVLGEGSICGVNTHRFEPSNKIKKEIRASIGVDDNQVVFIFLGRLNRDKGIYELLQAYNRLAEENPNTYLLLVGSDEENCLASLAQYAHIKEGTNFKFCGHTSKPEEVLQAGDVFCLPSYREGFGSSALEAACLGIPVICSDAYGLQDAYVNHQTGLKCKVGDSESLYNQMLILHRDKTLRTTYGTNGRDRVLAKFTNEEITNKWVQFYESLLSQ